MPIRVLLADDHALIRQGLRALLEKHGFQIVAEASDGQEALRSVMEANPDVAIVAVVGENMRGTPGIAGRTFNALGRENVNLIAIAQGSSESNISFVIDEKSVKTALNTTHREFGLDASPN